MVMPWQDHRGNISLLRIVALVLMSVPALVIAYQLAFGLMGSKPINAALHQTGSFAVRLLLFTLLITPLREITGSTRFVPLRRLIGLGALAYALLHVLLFIVDERFDLVKVSSEIVMRFYLGIGFLSLLAMIFLGVTSTDAAIRRMGEDWHKLHKLIYPLTILALFHAFLQSKINVDEAVVMSGIFCVLMGVRLMRKRITLTFISLTLLIFLSMIITMAVEYLWYALATGVPAERVFMANFDVELAPRPALIVFLFGMALPILTLFFKPPSRKGRRIAKVS